MPASFHVLQEVPLPWRQRQPKRVLILAEAAEFAPRVQTLLKEDGWATYVPMGASTWLQLVHRHRPSVVICDLDHAGVAALHLAREVKQDSAFQYASFHRCLRLGRSAHRAHRDGGRFQLFVRNTYGFQTTGVGDGWLWSASWAMN